MEKSSTNGSPDAANGEITQKKLPWDQRSEGIRRRHFFAVKGSERMEKVFWQMTEVDPHSNVLVTGESGTGKTFAARAIHDLTHTQGKFAKVTMTAIPEELVASELFGHMENAYTGAQSRRRGLFEIANNGTLFLDEIGEISYRTQVELLGALDIPRSAKRIGSNDDIKLHLLAICATQKNLLELVREGLFHEPLYRRLRQKVIHLPSLSESGPQFVEHLIFATLQSVAKKMKKNSPLDIHAKTLQRMSEMSYPGNARELRDLLSEMASRAYKNGSQQLQNDDLEIALDSRGNEDAHECNSNGKVKDETGKTLPEIVADCERRAILVALAENNYSRAETAAALGINRVTLFNKIRKYNLVIDERTLTGGRSHTLVGEQKNGRRKGRSV